jgi:hypothetical protein
MAGFVRRARLGRLAVTVGLSTVALTASFVGLVAFVTGSVTGTLSRVPIYLVLTAAVFVAAVVLFEESSHERRRTLVAPALTAAATLFVVGFGGEGVVYALADPEAAIRSQLFIYLLSAALIATGVGYWGWRNWAWFRPAGIGNSL